VGVALVTLRQRSFLALESTVRVCPVLQAGLKELPAGGLQE
jgi:hypothetical protein